MKMHVLLAAVFAVGAQAATINLNTGQQPGTVGTFSDPIWKILSAPAGTGINTSGAAYIEHNSYPRGDGLNQLWQTTGLPSTSVANYISAGDCGRNGYTASCPAGTYSFTTSFTITDLPSAILKFQVAGDNQVDVYLNGGGSLYHQGAAAGFTGWQAMSAVQTITSGLQLGVNTLELRVSNTDIYTGGILTGTVQQADTPEPATLVVTGMGLCLVALARRRKA